MINEEIFAARIYSIDRFTGEPPLEFVKKYHTLLSRYFDISVLSGILCGIPEFYRIHSLLERSRNLAQTEIDTTEERSSSGKNLASVFSRLSLTGVQKPRKDFYHYHMEELTPEHIYPEKDLTEDENTKLLSEFYCEMDRLVSCPPDGYPSFMVCFERISQQYMWCYAASSFEGEDISLYDTMKVTEAVMSCLVRCENKEKPFTMVTGDFSGIQKYIFSIASANHNNVAKRLRARSFYVDVISRVFSQYVADSFSVGRANILLQTGGKFYCIVPTLDRMEEKLTSIRNAFDKYLYETFQGSVSVNMAWLICGDDSLTCYSDTIVKLNELLGENKAGPFRAVLKNGHGWNPEAFVLCDTLKNKHLCKNCGSGLANGPESSCDMCNMQIAIGSTLPRTKYIIYTRNPGNDTYPVFNDYYIKLTDSIHYESMDGVYLIEALNGAPVKGKEASFPVIWKYMANHIPSEKYIPKTFGQIAEESMGMDKLAVLKADVDILGFLFSQGLRTKDKHFGTISRVNTMSRMLEIFFSGYIEKLLESEAYNNVYSVFSGGDDLFLIGPWDIILELTADIQKKFQVFAAENESVTMSAAVSVFNSNEHIAFMAEYSEQQLKRAKNECNTSIYPDRTGRNAVCAVNQVFSWPDYNEQLSNAAKLEQLLYGHMADTGVLYRILRYSSMYKQFLEDKDIWKLMFEPLFYYDRKRNYKFNLNEENCRWFLDSYIKSMDNAANYHSVKKNLYFAETTVKIALNKTRKGRS